MYYDENAPIVFEMLGCAYQLQTNNVTVYTYIICAAFKPSQCEKPYVYF